MNTIQKEFFRDDVFNALYKVFNKAHEEGAISFYSTDSLVVSMKDAVMHLIQDRETYFNELKEAGEITE